MAERRFLAFHMAITIQEAFKTNCKCMVKSEAVRFVDMKLSIKKSMAARLTSARIAKS